MTEHQTTKLNMALLNLHPLLRTDDFVPKDLGFRHERSDTYDILNNDKEFRLMLDVPGVKASDLDLTIDDGLIRISGTRRKLSPDGETFKKIKFVRAFKCDQQIVDLTAIKANLEDGVLTVWAPKRTKPEPRKITISVSTLAEEAKKLEDKKADRTIEVETVDPQEAEQEAKASSK